jgi:hypothetical protein
VRRVDDADGLAAMPLAFGESASHAAVKSVDRGVEYAARSVEVTGAEGIWVARQTGARQRQTPRVGGAFQAGWNLVGLKRLVVTVAAD